MKVIEGQDIKQWTDTELEAGKDYYYVVRAFKRFNGTILYGNYIKISASTLPEDVTGLKLSSLTTDAIKLVWNTSSGATDYDIYQESSKTPGTFVKIENISTNSYASFEKLPMPYFEGKLDIGNKNPFLLIVIPL